MPQTVFILGAGASAEIGLPVGDGLAEKITELLNIRYADSQQLVSGDAVIAEALTQVTAGSEKRYEELKRYLIAARRTGEGMSLAASIDNFLDAHRGDKHIELCGKLGIVRSILIAEHDSGLAVDPRRPDIPPNLPGIRDAWFRLFWQLLCEGCTADEFQGRSQSVSFVIFNYDRCLEHFLFHAARAYYGLRPDHAAELINTMRFYHPYGSVGWLPWQRKEQDVVDYGAGVSAGELVTLSKRIKTFTESAQDNVIGPIRQAVDAAQRIVFLGFAYHLQNLRLLWPKTVGEIGAKRRYFGTAFGISDSDVNVLVDEIAARTGIDEHSGALPQIKCAKLLHEYKQSLSMV